MSLCQFCDAVFLSDLELENSYSDSSTDEGGYFRPLVLLPSNQCVCCPRSTNRMQSPMFTSATSDFLEVVPENMHEVLHQHNACTASLCPKLRTSLYSDKVRRNNAKFSNSTLDSPPVFGPPLSSSTPRQSVRTHSTYSKSTQFSRPVRIPGSPPASTPRVWCHSKRRACSQPMFSAVSHDPSLLLVSHDNLSHDTPNPHRNCSFAGDPVLHSASHLSRKIFRNSTIRVQLAYRTVKRVKKLTFSMVII